MNNKLKMLLALTLLMPVTTFALEKSETIYTNLNTTGKITNITVVNHLVNKETGTIDDESMLTDILNINGEEKFKIENNNIKWSTKGSDIYYRGKIDKNLPIDTKITYYLNGKKMNSKDMIGKSGSVKIKLAFTNNEKNRVLVNGVYTDMYTPFVVTVGTILNNNSSNISITNGKVINNGTKNILVGISSPGLYDSIGLNSLKGMDEITITYDTKKFSLGNIYIVSTPKLLDNSDLDIFNKLDTVYSSVNALQTNMNKIEDGSKEVTKGSNTLKNSLETSIASLNKLTGDALSQEQINSIKDASVCTVESMYTDDYKNEIALNTWNTVKNNLNPNDPEVVNIVKSQVEEAVVEYLQDSGKYNDYVACEIGKSIQSQGGTMTPEQANSCSIIASDQYLPVISKYSSIAAKNTAQSTSMYVAEKVSKEVSVTVSSMTASNVAGSVAEKVSKEVANNVRDSAMDTIKTSLNTLYNGVDKLNNGINKLDKGISAFNSEGINKLSNTANKLVNYSNKAQALVELTNNYKGFASNNSTRVLFISMVKSSK